MAHLAATSGHERQVIAVRLLQNGYQLARRTYAKTLVGRSTHADDRGRLANSLRAIGPTRAVDHANSHSDLQQRETDPGTIAVRDPMHGTPMAHQNAAAGHVWRTTATAGLAVTRFLRGAMGEELGLRGVALPRLQQRMSPFTASLVLGVVWGLWHLPVLLGRDPVSVAAFLLLVIALTFVFAWLFNGSSGSLLPRCCGTPRRTGTRRSIVFPGIAGTDWELLSSLGVLMLGIIAAVAVRRGRHPAVTSLTS